MRFGVYDLETYDLGGDVAGCGAYDGKEYAYYDSIIDLVDHMAKSEVMIWYAHNGGEYDVKYLLDHIMNTYYCYYILINGSLNLQAYETARTRRRTSKRDGELKEYRELNNKLFELRDSVLILPDSLKNLSVAFNVAHGKQDYDDYIEHKDKEKMKEYLKYDCLALYEILKAYQDELGFEKLWTTTASTAINVFKERFGGKEWLKCLGRNRPEYRNGYYGGRCEVFRRYGEDLHYYDVNSLYPYVMHDKDYPIGSALFTKEYIPDKLGFYHITACCPDDLHIPLLPYRDVSGKLLFPSGVVDGWYYSPEIEKALNLGYKITFHQGYVWENTYNPFREYVDYYYGIKKNAKGVKRYMAKLLLNSLYGKFAQKEEGTKLVDLKGLTLADIEENEIYMYPNEDRIAYQKCKRYGDFIKPHISCFVTCYSRLHLYSFMEKVGLKNVYYCDTDSIVSDVELETGNELGEMKEEHRVKKGVFLLPKIYSFLNDKDEYIIKAKGLSAEKLSYEDYELALSGDYSRIYSEVRRVMGIRKKLNSGYEGNFYDTMILEKHIHGIFNKRILHEDGITTEPLKL